MCAFNFGFDVGNFAGVQAMQRKSCPPFFVHLALDLAKRKAGRIKGDFLVHMRTAGCLPSTLRAVPDWYGSFMQVVVGIGQRRHITSHPSAHTTISVCMCVRTCGDEQKVRRNINRGSN